MRCHSLALLITYAGLVHAGLLHTAPALAADAVDITGQRVVVRDVLPACPKRACEADLGAAPPPGSSRWLPGPVILKAIEESGEDGAAYAGLKGVRVRSASRALSPAQVGELFRPAIERAMPAGVQLSAVEAKSALVLPLLSSVGQCTLPALPRRAGRVTSTALVDVLHEGVLVRREPVLVRLVISEAAARSDVPRGHTLTLLIERRSATISAHGIALRDAEIGELAPFKVQRTGRVVQARVTSQTTAVVQEGP